MVIPPVLGAVCLTYFAVHALQGDRGLLSWWQLQKQVTQVQAEADVLAVERASLAHQVALLRPESLDRDMLDEQARGILALGRADERVILFDAP